ncbi:MAG: hypothetical protein IKC42_06050 [Alistipes sp.]|nr:hypothetical protein [Alistipes sp.]
MRKLLIFTAVALLAIVEVVAQRTKAEIFANDELARGVYRFYPTEFKEQTPVPKGYKPFYISHYGRHGSRYIEKEHEIDVVAKVMDRAAREGAFTEFGKEYYLRWKEAEAICRGRAGMLTQTGVEQLRQIANRMYHTYPEIFKGRHHITSLATYVPRVLLSMNSFTNEMVRLNPKLRFTIDTGVPHQGYLNPYCYDNDRALGLRVDKCRYPKAEWVKGWQEYLYKTVDPMTTLRRIFKKEFADSISEKDAWVMSLHRNASSLAGTPASHIVLSDAFTAEENYLWWRMINLRYYIERGNSGIDGGFLSDINDRLMAKIIDDADVAIYTEKPTATLRFGHDGVIIGLLNSMGVGGWAERFASYDEVEERFRDFDIPMASTLMFVFYRNKEGDVLVKALLNEEEIELPVKSATKPYYRWSDVRQDWVVRLQNSQLYDYSTGVLRLKK